MVSSILDRIPLMSREGLKVLLANARARPHLPEASAIVQAVEATLKPKSTSPAARPQILTDEERERVRARWSEAPLVDRIEAAFADRPPTEAELKRLRILHENPDTDESQLVAIAGDRGPGKFSLVLGELARDRIEYLPDPKYVPGRDKPNWSETICFLKQRKNPSGRISHGWNLKPETVEALQRLGYLPS